MKTLKIFVLGISCLLLSACVTTTNQPTVGSKPSDTPPRLVNSKVRQGVEWDNLAAFGPVPANLQKEGDAICSQDTFIFKSKAIGYHPKALDKAGKPIDGGGYACSA